MFLNTLKIAYDQSISAYSNFGFTSLIFSLELILQIQVLVRWLWSKNWKPGLVITTEITHLIHFSSMLLLLFAGNLTHHYYQLIMFYTEKANVFYHVTQVNLVCPDKKNIFFFMRTKPISPNNWIGHFWVSLAQASVPNEVLSAQPLIWKWFSILMQIKRKVVHFALFWNWGFLELGSGLFHLRNDLVYLMTDDTIIKRVK